MIQFTSYPIYVPSKGRADVSMTMTLLQEAGLHFYAVVEKEDFQSYVTSDKFRLDEKQIIVLPKSDQGIVYVRNYCKAHAISFGHGYHWQIDDNIKKFKKRIDGKNIEKSPSVILNEVEAFVYKHKNIGIAGLKHACFAFAAKEDYGINQQIYTCMLINNRLDINWRDGCVEDTDYSMQVLFAGYCTILFNRLVMDKATTMSQKGGNTEISYSGAGRLNRSEKLQEYWPGIFTLRKDNQGRVRVNPSRIWKTFRQRPEEGIL